MKMLKRGGGKFVQTLGASKSWINERPGSGLETSTGPARHIKLVYDALSPPKWRMGWPLLTQHRLNRHPWRAEAYVPHCAPQTLPLPQVQTSKKSAETWMKLSTIHQPKKSPSLETSILSDPLIDTSIQKSITLVQQDWWKRLMMVTFPFEMATQSPRPHDTH